MQFAGELNNVSLPNLIQLIGSGSLTGKMTLSNESTEALICFEKGHIVHVENDKGQGREVLFDLFLWPNGKFAFVEDTLQGVARSIDPANSSDTRDALLRDGMSYAEQRTFLEGLKIHDKTVLKAKEGFETVTDLQLRKVLDFLNGRTTLIQALQKAKITKLAATEVVYKLISQELVEVLGDVVVPKTQSVYLPDWVIARLRQDNRDLSQAIIDMVIWVDRVKCWMYQTDADLQVVLDNIDASKKETKVDHSTADS
jgi:hypothetical protein